MRNKPTTLLLTMSLALVATASADWRPTQLTDPRTGDPIDGVAGDNEAGFHLDLYLTETGEAHTLFRLPPGTLDFLDDSKAPVLRIDQGQPQGVALLEASLTWAAFPAWNGSDGALSGLLRDLMEGEQLQVTYFLAGGGYKETQISLSGAREVIAKAFDIPAEVSPEERDRARELEAALLDEGARCAKLKGKKRQRCVDLVRSCLGDAESVAALRSCLADGG